MITHKDPIANLLDHVSNPTGANILTNLAKLGA